MRQTELRLSREDRKTADAVRSKGESSARQVNRAHILLSLDRLVPEAQIMAVLGVGRTAVWRTRAAYREGGLSLALYDVQRSGRPPKYATDVEAKITALACSQAPVGSARWTLERLHAAAIQEPGLSHISVATIGRMLKKNCLKPWRKVMWCIAALTLEYRKRMYHLLGLYARLEKKQEPVVCVDEKSLQILTHSRAPMPMRPGRPRKEDYEYERRGTVNLFVAVEPKAGLRTVVVTERRGKADFVGFIQTLLDTAYKQVKCLHVVLDNLNTHFKKAFVDVLGEHQAAQVLRRVRFHYTPKHASWLNMAEIEIGVLTRQCLATRFATRQDLERSVKAWQERRNEQRSPLEWTFTRQKADAKLARHYVS